MQNIKNFILLLALTITSGLVFSQATVESIVINKKNRNAVKLYVSQPVDITSSALATKLERSGVKSSGKSNKGVTVYKEVVLSEISTTKLDIYTSVQKRGDGSVVYMAASKGYDNFSTPDDPIITENIIAYLNTLSQDARFKGEEVNLNLHNEQIAKVEREYQKLLDDMKSIEQSKTDAEVKLVQIKAAIAQKRIEIDKLKKERDSMKYNSLLRN